MSVELGFYGKLPSHGDFVRRRVPAAFLDTWDPWLADCMEASARALSERWLDSYLTSPIWRFVLSADVAGPDAILGLLMPSVDCVGRYFPLTLVTRLPPAVTLLGAAFSSMQWYETLEDIAVSVLQEDMSRSIDDFDREVIEHADRLSLLEAREISPPGSGAPVLIEAAAVQDLGLAVQAACDAFVSALAKGASFWWTRGSERVAPSAFVCKGLPSRDSFAALLAGEWEVAGYPRRLLAHSPAKEHRAPIVSMPSWTRVRSASTTMETTSGAVIDCPDSGLWAVAAVASGDPSSSRTVISALGAITAAGDLQQRVNAARATLAEVNFALCHPFPRVDSETARCAVCILLTGVEEACLVWQGDVRVYRLRDGCLEDCVACRPTVTASTGPETGTEAETSMRPQSEPHMPRLDSGESRMDVRFMAITARDRFLICVPEPGVPDADVQRVCGAETPEACCEQLCAALSAAVVGNRPTALAVFFD